MIAYLRLTLESDATFGRGDGVPGSVDAEVEHDPRTGLPFIRGRTLKGLLVEECANILYSLSREGAPCPATDAAEWMFGRPGSGTEGHGHLHVGPALLPAELRQWAERATGPDGGFTREAILESLTAIRRQTAVDDSGAPARGSLRSMRVVLRDTSFFARLQFREEPNRETRSLLAACSLSVRRAGTGRNRGRGRCACALLNANGEDVTTAWLGDWPTNFGG